MHTVKMESLTETIQICNRCYFEHREYVSDEPFDRSLGSTCKICGGSPSDLTYGDHLFNLSEATEELRVAQGLGQTTAATAKYAGKLLVNTAVIGAKCGFKLLKHAPTVIERMAEQVKK